MALTSLNLEWTKRIADAMGELVEWTDKHADHSLDDPLMSMYLAVGLAGEAGELANVVAKRVRRGEPILHKRHKLISEIGDVLWYLLRFCRVHRINMDDVLIDLQAKLAIRENAKRPRKIKDDGVGDIIDYAPPLNARGYPEKLVMFALAALGLGDEERVTLIQRNREVYKTDRRTSKIVDAALWLISTAPSPPSSQELARAFGFNSHTPFLRRMRNLAPPDQPVHGPIKDALTRFQRLLQTPTSSLRLAEMVNKDLPKIRVDWVVKEVDQQLRPVEKLAKPRAKRRGGTP